MSKHGFIQLRTQQSLRQLAKDPDVTVFAPAWVKAALEKLSIQLQGMQFEIEQSNRYYTIDKNMSLVDLLAIARAESANTTGIIDFDQYPGLPKATVIALRDLVKHCVIIGTDTATHFGGYPKGKPVSKLNQEVYICDLPGLQFQELNNTGRHVLLSEKDDLPKGVLDNDIYINTVGAPKKTYKEAMADKSGRFLTGLFKNKAVLFDSKAFHAFVAQDFVLSAQALNTHAKAHNPNRNLSFKFLKYGAGFFAEGLDGKARTELDVHLSFAVYFGLQQLLAQPADTYSHIKRIELPFFDDTDNPGVKVVLGLIALLCKEKGIEFASDKNDALAPTSKHMTATTNCSDPHAPTGNEMNYGSVDAAIAENLKRKGNNFSPICNPAMKAQYINIQHLAQGISTDLENILNKESTSFWQPILKRKWSLLAATLSSVSVRAGALLWLGLRASWATCLSIGGLVLLGVELVRCLRDKFKDRQYQNYKAKEASLTGALTDAQREAFEIGKDAAQSICVQAKSCFMWRAYQSSNDYYAGYQAALLNDEVLIKEVKKSKKIK